MDKKAKWIWKNGENNENTWMNLVKSFTLEQKPCSARAKIAVDSKYWMYINGVLAVFEGGVKRGPSLNSTYYDEIDLTAYLKTGENKIAVLVWYFGKSGFSHNSSGMGGFLFEADIDGEVILSDGSWQIMKNPAYVQADEKDIKPNFRLPEPNIYFDAAKDLGQWFSPEYDTAEWDRADEICGAGEGIWGTLHNRAIPQLKDFRLRNYENPAPSEVFTTTGETVVEMKLPYNAQLTPYLKISAEAGKKIIIKTDTYDTIWPQEKNNMSVYYTKEGEQEYEALGWINGERVYYVIPSGVTIHSLKYRETGYDTEFKGSFVCDDEFLNKLWQKSLRTLYVTMRDTFMDCPDRERVQWWGDVNVEMQMMMYCLDGKALLLYRKGVDSMAGWAGDYGSMLTVVPSGTEQYELPLQNLAGIWGFPYYYDYTGDKSVIERIYPASKNYVLNYHMGSDGLAEHKSGSWDWADWGENADIAPMENAWYYMALQGCVKMAGLLGLDRDIEAYSERIRSIEENYDRRFLKDGYYYGTTANGLPDDRANALAVLSGLAGEEQYDSILHILKRIENASPYMEKYVLDALCEMGHVDAAVERIKRRYKEMTESHCSTLWEYWNTDGTRNHAWSGGPLVTMSKYMAGIRPLDTAYRTFEIKPHMCGLNDIKCTVPSAKGSIVLELSKRDGHIHMEVTIPKHTTAEVYYPVCEEKQAFSSKYEFTISGGYAKFIFTEGTYQI